VYKKTTFLCNIISIKVKDKFSYQQMFGRKAKISTSLRIFEEMGAVTTKGDIQWKLKNCGLTCMFVGYSVDHANDAYRILNLNSKRIIQKRVFL
jgi:hypothetical protein